MRVYITRYALSQGIFEVEAEECGFGGMIRTKERYFATYHNEGKDWHRTKESAIKRAEEMRIKKIRSLEKQIEGLKNLRFE